MATDYFLLVYEVRWPVERDSLEEARDLAQLHLQDLREDIETRDPDGPSVGLKEIRSLSALPECTCGGPFTDEFGAKYHLMSCAISRKAQSKRGLI